MKNKMLGYLLALMAILFIVSSGAAISSGIRCKNLKKENDALKAKTAQDAKPAAKSEAPPAKIADSPAQNAEEASSELKNLRKKLSDRNGELENLKKENAALQDKLKNQPEGRRWQDDGRGGGRSDFFERLRKEDPERYKQVRQHVDEMTQRVETVANEQQNFLGKLDTSRMTDEQLENHNKILDMVKKNAEIAARINQDPEAEGADELRREMFDNFRNLRGLLDTERSYALQELGRSMGYGEQDTATFTEYVSQIYNMTSMRALFGGGHHNDGRPPGQNQGGQGQGGGDRQQR